MRAWCAEGPDSVPVSLHARDNSVCTVHGDCPNLLLSCLGCVSIQVVEERARLEQHADGETARLVLLLLLCHSLSYARRMRCTRERMRLNHSLQQLCSILAVHSRDSDFPLRSPLFTSSGSHNRPTPCSFAKPCMRAPRTALVRPPSDRLEEQPRSGPPRSPAR